MCHHVFMYDGRYRNTNSQTNGLTKYISNIQGGVIQNELQLVMINMYFRVCVKIFNR